MSKRRCASCGKPLTTEGFFCPDEWAYEVADKRRDGTRRLIPVVFNGCSALALTDEQVRRIAEGHRGHRKGHHNGMGAEPKRHPFNGGEISVREFAEQFVVGQKLVRGHLKRGGNLDELAKKIQRQSTYVG